jgi:hypothetical protein
VGTHQGEDLEWDNSFAGFRASINSNEEIPLLPCPDFPRWLPFQQRKKIYLKNIETTIRDIYLTHPLLKLLPYHQIEFHIETFRAITEKYCLQIEQYYKKKGYHRYRKYPITPEKKRNIRWTVEAYVAKRQDEAKKEIAKIARSERCSQNTVKDSIKEILRTIDLPIEPIFHPMPGRPLHSKDSQTSKRQQFWFD